MVLNRFLMPRLMSPAGDGGDGGGGAADRGDDFVPNEDDTTDGASGDDTLKGAGDDTLKGTGDDTAEGGEGDDTAEGGEGDGTAEGSDGEEKPGKKKPGGIPWSRHKELMKKEREAREVAERELAKFKSGDTIAATNKEIKETEDKITTMDAEYAQLVTDGKHQEATAKMREIRALERELTEKKSDFKAKVAETRAIERVRYDNTVSKLEEAYPAINPDHEEYDEEVAQDVMDLAETYNRKGDTPAKALQRAAEKLLGTVTKKQEQATGTDTQVSAEDKAKAVAEERRRAQLKKNLAVKDKQPASKEKVGSDHDKAGGGIDAKSVSMMKFDDFIKIPDEELARLRGDIVA